MAVPLFAVEQVTGSALRRIPFNLGAAPIRGERLTVPDLIQVETGTAPVHRPSF